MTKAGREVVAVIDQPREQLVGELMADWTAAERRDLARLMKRFAGDMNAWVQRHQSADAADASEESPRRRAGEPSSRRRSESPHHRVGTTASHRIIQSDHRRGVEHRSTIT